MEPTIGNQMKIELAAQPDGSVAVVLVLGEMTCTIDPVVGVGIGTMLIQYAAVATERNRLAAESKPRLVS
jgi:hypothetical protein